MLPASNSKNGDHHPNQKDAEYNINLRLLCTPEKLVQDHKKCDYNKYDFSFTPVCGFVIVSHCNGWIAL